MMIPVTYHDDHAKAEQIIMEAAQKHTVMVKDLNDDAVAELQRRYHLRYAEIGPRVYWRITDNWLEMTVRFICLDHGIREVKDAMSRHILSGLGAAKIGIASSTYDVVGFPPVRVIHETRPAPSA